MHTVRLGTDPEVFALHPETGEVLPAYFALGLPSGNPKTVHLPYGILGGDGAALEFQQNPAEKPNQVAQYLYENLSAVRQHITTTAVDIRGNRVQPIMSATPVVYVGRDYLDYLTPDFGSEFSLQILGCAKDFVVYDMDTKVRPNPMKTLMRTSGGHIHIDVGPYVNDEDVLYFLTALLDQTLGLWAYMHLQRVSGFLERMQLYGDLGTIRVNLKYGTLEYRSLPAVALLNDVVTADLVFSAAQELAQAVFTWQEENQLAEKILPVVGDFAAMVARRNMIQELTSENLTPGLELSRELLGRLDKAAGSAVHKLFAHCPSIETQPMGL